MGQNANPSTTSKNLGLVKAIHVGIAAPTNLYMIWADTNDLVTVHKYYNHQLSLWMPIGAGVGGGTYLTSVELGRIIFVAKTGDDTTGVIGDLAKPFLTINAAISKAIALTGADALSITNRMVILVYPGHYDESVVLSGDFIDIYAYSSKSNMEMISYSMNSMSYGDHKRGTSITAMDWESKNNFVVGIDFDTIEFLGIQSNLTQVRFLKSSACNNIASDDVATAKLIHIVLDHVTATNCLQLKRNATYGVFMNNCKFNNLFKYDATQNAFTNITTSVFNNIETFSDSFECEITYSHFNNCKFGISNFNRFRVKDTTFDDCGFADDCLIEDENGEYNHCKFGTGCLKDMINTTVKDSSCVHSIGVGGSLDYVHANLTAVVAQNSYSGGFADARLFYGKMRLMHIHCTIDFTPCLRIHLPLGFHPSDIERSTIIHCGETVIGADTIVGDNAYISYCKLSKVWSNSNLLGAPNVSFNIVTTILCNPDGFEDPPIDPISFNSNGKSDEPPARFNFIAELSTDREGTEIEVTFPTGAVETHIVEIGNSGGATEIEFSVSPSITMEGTHTFRIRTIGVVFDGINVINASPWMLPLLVNWVNTPRAKAWRGYDMYCVKDYAAYTVINYDENTGEHQLQRNYDDGTETVIYTIETSGGVEENAEATFSAGELETVTIGIGISGGFISFTPTGYTGERTQRNTSYKGWNQLQRYYIDDEFPTGEYKSNDIGDGDYIEPFIDNSACPIGNP